MASKQTVIGNSLGDSITVELQTDGRRQVGIVMVDGVRYHLERMRATELLSKYKADLDPEYRPQTDRQGCCVVLVPFSKKSPHVRRKAKIRN